jgi:hypothetical protein
MSCRMAEMRPVGLLICWSIVVGLTSGVKVAVVFFFVCIGVVSFIGGARANERRCWRPPKPTARPDGPAPPPLSTSCKDGK